MSQGSGFFLLFFSGGATPPSVRVVAASATSSVLALVDTPSPLSKPPFLFVSAPSFFPGLPRLAFFTGPSTAVESLVESSRGVERVGEVERVEGVEVAVSWASGVSAVSSGASVVGEDEDSSVYFGVDSGVDSNVDWDVDLDVDLDVDSDVNSNVDSVDG
jgi:hypothetical protein